MKEIHLLSVGKLKDKNLLELEKNYKKRITSFKFFIHELKTHEENLNLEAKEVLKKLTELQAKPENTILLEEKGKQFKSKSFSGWLYKNLEHQAKVFFIIGGASGHGESVKKSSRQSISLSLMTFPHQVARILLVEQIYRAETIFLNHPYHK